MTGAGESARDRAIICPSCGSRSKSKVEAFEHERPHLMAMRTALQNGWSWSQYQHVEAHTSWVEVEAE